MSLEQLNHFKERKIYYIETQEYKFLDIFKLFPKLKYYYILINYRTPIISQDITYSDPRVTELVRSGKMKGPDDRLFFQVKVSYRFLNNEYDIDKLENIYTSSFEKGNISYFNGELICNSHNDTGTPFSENSSLGVSLNLLFYRRQMIRKWIKINIDKEYYIGSISIKESEVNGKNLNIIIDSNDIRQFTGGKW